MLEPPPVRARVLIINANNVVKRIRCARSYTSQWRCTAIPFSDSAAGESTMVGGPVCISQQIYGYLVHVRDKARTFWLSAI